MLRSGPIGSPYPGKYISLGMAAFCAVVLWRASRSLMKTVRDERRDSAQGISVKPDPKNSIGANLAVGLMVAYLLAMLLFAMYREWPN